MSAPDRCPHCGQVMPIARRPAPREGIPLQELRSLARRRDPIWQGIAKIDPAKWEGDFTISVERGEVIRQGDGFVIGPAGHRALEEEGENR